MLTVVIIGILAAAAVPHFTDATTDAQDAALRQNLHTVRKQIELFKAQHGGHLPGWNNLDNFEVHMCGYSNEAGDGSWVPDADHPLGPYLPSTVLVNPVNGGVGAKFTLDIASETPDDEMVEGDQRVGWFFNATTGEIAANAEGTTSDGTPRSRL